MMVNELMVGNYILFKLFGKGAGKIGAMKKGDFARFNNEEYHPIPLTPEWLERCGLKQKPPEPDDLPQWENLNMNIAQYTDGFYLYTITSDPWHDQAVGKKIEYVHQLQNISVVLFGEELIIEL